MPSFKPDDFSTASPYLIVSDAAATIAFLREALGATLLRTFPGPEGRMRHAELKIDDTVIMVADSAPEWPPMPAHVHVYVPDVDATYARALECGAVSVQEPAKRDDPDRRGGVKDVGGTTWWIATRVE